jgi:hypothetical protein
MREASMKKQLFASVVLAIIGGFLWWSIVSKASDELQYFGFLLAGFGAGLAGLKPWWTAPALTIFPIGASIYHVQTHRMGICAQIGVVFGLVSILGASAFSSFAGNLLMNRSLRRHLGKIVFGGEQ